VEDPLSEELLKGEFDGKTTILIDVKEVGDHPNYEGALAAAHAASTGAASA
jgi:hypothetical protein